MSDDPTSLFVRMTVHSILLEEDLHGFSEKLKSDEENIGDDEDTQITSGGGGGGNRIALRLGYENLLKHKKFSLFPGQVVYVKGVNESGSSFIVHDIFTDAISNHRALPLRRIREINFQLAETLRPASMMVACGPFVCHHQDPLSYGPLYDLLDAAALQQPDILFLVCYRLIISHHILKIDGAFYR